MVEERGGAPGILKTHFGKQTYGKVSHSRTVCHKETRSQRHHTVCDSSDKKLLSGHGITKWAFTPQSGGLISCELCSIEGLCSSCFYSLTQPDQTYLLCVKEKIKGDWLCFFSSVPEHLISRMFPWLPAAASSHAGSSDFPSVIKCLLGCQIHFTTFHFSGFLQLTAGVVRLGLEPLQALQHFHNIMESFKYTQSASKSRSGQ